MAVGGSDDTRASSLPTLSDGHGDVAEIIAGRYQLVRWLGGAAGTCPRPAGG